MHKFWTSLLIIEGIMCLHKNLIYIKPTRNLYQLECNYSMVDSPIQSSQIAKGKYTTTSTSTLYIVDSNKHIQYDKYVYTKVFLLQLLDKVCVNHQYQCLPPLACQNIQQLGLHRRGKRRGKRRNRPLDIIRPCRTNPKNLVRVSIEVDISKDQPDMSLTFSLLNAQSVKNKDLIIHHQIVQNKTDILLLTKTWLTSKETDKICIDSSDLNKDRYKLTSAIRENRRGGSLALITKKDFKVKLDSNAEFRTFQFAKWYV